MPPDPAPAVARRAVSALDDRIEVATGHDIDTLWAHRDRGVLDKSHAHLVDLHRRLAQTEAGVTFYRTLLHRLASGEFPVDSALFERIDRTIGQLGKAAEERDTAEARVIAVLEPIETAARGAHPEGRELIPAADQAALLAVARGAKLHEHLLTGRMSVVTASGKRIPYTHFQQLETAGLVSRDTRCPVHAGQPVALTDAGRVALASNRRAHTAASPAAAPPGRWPHAARARR
ncbi:hypothetical protein ABZ557_27290 [Streptomyces sp. NPDC019645]|uniref:hypothetical protein n=1 Tax=Streptomyces sp. NPDC019645 TaxID=3154786 RepID=UPI0033F6757A